MLFGSSMRMPMMDVGKVNVPMDDCFVPVRVGMRLDAIPFEIVCMLVVRVVPMRMGVLNLFVSMLVFMMLAQMQPEADRHERCGDTQLQRNGVAKEPHRQDSAVERSDRKIGAGPRRSQVSQREDKQRKAHSVPEEPYRCGFSDPAEARHCISQTEREGEIDGARDESLQARDH